MSDPLTIMAIAGTFLLAGTVKGVIGLGLPTISLALLTVAIDLHSAMALMLVPSLVTNLWQALAGGNAGPILRRIWPFLLMAIVTIWLGATALTRIDPSWLSALLGLLLVAYAAAGLAGRQFTITSRQEVWIGPLLGSINGILTGMTGSFVVPGVLFLQAVGLSRDMLIQAMGILFCASTLALALALQGNGLLTAQSSIVSAASLVPAIAGMWIGQNVGQKLSESRFRRIFFLSLLILGGYIVAGATGAG